MLDNNQQKDNKISRSLNIAQVFARRQTILGLPNNVFAMGAGVGLTIVFLLSKFLGIFFLIVYFKIMYAIHEEDPKALDVWISALKHGTKGWQASKVRTTRLIVI